MNDVPTFRYEDPIRRIKIYASTEAPDQYIFKVGGYFGLVVQTAPSCAPQKLYGRVLELIERGKAHIRRELEPPWKDLVVIDAAVIAWRGDMKGETLRRLEAAENGLGGLDRWAHKRSYRDNLVRSLWLQADGPDHMTRVRALNKLADIYGITAPDPILDSTGGVLLVDAIEAGDEEVLAPTE